jgi:IrrE N-terminal-like domain
VNDGCLDRIADSISQQFGLSVPTDLKALSTGLGVDRIQLIEIPELGRLSWQDGNPVITLRKSLSKAQRRFTWAHELAHLVLEQEGPAYRRESIPLNAQLQESDDIERTCDKLASRFLLPTHSLYALTNREDFSLDECTRIAELARVSITSSFIRMREAFGVRDRSLIAYKQGGYLSTYCLPRAWGRPEEYRAELFDSKTGVIRLRFGGAWRSFHADFRGDERRGMALTHRVIPLTRSDSIGCSPRKRT